MSRYSKVDKIKVESSHKKCHPKIYHCNSIERYQAEHKIKRKLNLNNLFIDANEKLDNYEELLLYKESYLANMSNSYNFKNVKKAFYINDQINKHTTYNNDKNIMFKKYTSDRYYSMCLQSISHYDYSRAWIYFISAHHLDKSLNIPYALWNIMIKNK